MSEKKELILRLEVKKKLLQAELERLENDVNKSAVEYRKKLEVNISEIGKDIKSASEEFGEKISEKLNGWLS